MLALLKSTSKDATTAAPAQSQTGTLRSIDTMITRMETLKRKLSALHAEERLLHKQSRARVEHVQELHTIPSVADVKYDEWSKVRLNRLLVDYLLRCGYEESAKSLAKANGIEELVDIDEFVAARRIEQSLEEGRTSECLAWCGDNRAVLKKMGVSTICAPIASNSTKELTYDASRATLNTPSVSKNTSSSFVHAPSFAHELMPKST